MFSYDNLGLPPLQPLFQFPDTVTRDDSIFFTASMTPTFESTPPASPRVQRTNTPIKMAALVREIVEAPPFKKHKSNPIDAKAHDLVCKLNTEDDLERVSSSTSNAFHSARMTIASAKIKRVSTCSGDHRADDGSRCDKCKQRITMFYPRGRFYLQHPLSKSRIMIINGKTNDIGNFLRVVHIVLVLGFHPIAVRGVSASAVISHMVDIKERRRRGVLDVHFVKRNKAFGRPLFWTSVGKGNEPTIDSKFYINWDKFLPICAGLTLPKARVHRILRTTSPRMMKRLISCFNEERPCVVHLCRSWMILDAILEMKIRELHAVLCGYFSRGVIIDIVCNLVL
jgi:hypothetical protein